MTRKFRFGSLPLLLIGLTVVVLLAYLLWVPQGSTKPDENWTRIQNERVLRIGIDPSSPPFVLDDGTGKLSGFDIALANELANAWGVKIQYVYSGYDGLYDALNAKQFDIILSALPYNPNRTQDVFSRVPISMADLSWLSAAMTRRRCNSKMSATKRLPSNSARMAMRLRANGANATIWNCVNSILRSRRCTRCSAARRTRRLSIRLRSLIFNAPKRIQERAAGVSSATLSPMKITLSPCGVIHPRCCASVNSVLNRTDEHRPAG